MAKSLYDILEVSASASAEAIRASYDRLSDKLDPDAPQNSGKADSRIHYEAVKEAFLTLGDPARRARYDAGQQTRGEPYRSSVEALPGFWTLPRVLALALVLLLAAGWYAQHRNAEAKLATEGAIAEARATVAEAWARAEAAAAAIERLQAQRERELERQRAYQDSRNRNDFERARRDVDREQRSREYQERMAQERQAREQQYAARRKEHERERTETAAVLEARRRAAHEREELCRIERNRYGKAISC
jgi:curved DNA-binding protein CbpA